MHPEVISDEPGNCPKCGMKLVPMDPDRTRSILEARGEAVPETTGAGTERKILYWRDPMDPAYVRTEPGKSPMGMDLVPVYEDEVAGGPTIRIDPVTQQNMGLRYDLVRRGPLVKTVRTVGMVEFDERGLGTVTTKVAGWVEKVHVDLTGTPVQKGDALFDLYSPQLLSAQQEYLIALRDVEQAKGSAAALARARLESSRERLRLFDISEEQIDRLEQRGEPRKTLSIEAPLTGIVTRKNVTEGDYLEPGKPAYQTADLSTVWVIGKVYESDLAYVKLDQEATMRLDYLPGQTYHGRVTYIYPYLEKGTREIPVRMEFPNPDGELKPGMYATIELRSRLADDAVLAPATAVIDTGERQVVFVTRDGGKFEPRQIRIGLRGEGDVLQILSGLAPGEQVVVSGQFMLDSESRLREATLKMLEPGMNKTTDTLTKAPASEEPAAMGHEMQDMKMPETSSVMSHETQYVCPMPSHAGTLYDTPGDCPLCGMKLAPVTQSEAERFEKTRSADIPTTPSHGAMHKP
jgi:Cu(I)/Ag(I) efflux system membrane fusion protein/cobalt-zinc-cadmium efflux system membrane fusion protein